MPAWSKTKARIFSGKQQDVENQLNEFLQQKEPRVIKDIRFSTTHIVGAPTEHSVLVMYEEIDLSNE